MSVAAYNRGSRLLAREADERIRIANMRADRQAHNDEIERLIKRLREQVASLERDLRRARRCIAAVRYSREQLRLRLAAEERAYEFAVGLLCKGAFPAHFQKTQRRFRDD